MGKYLNIQMNKTIQINLAGRSLQIDENAFSTLQDYLERVQSSLKDQEGSEEIFQDVEARMAELFEEKLTNGRQVISIDDVTAVIKIMGSPEEYRIGSDTSDEQEGETIRPKKRIFRDPDNRIIGGVAGGLGAYFGLDPILFRAVFLILLWTGSGVIAYLILMLVIPRAKTTAQRLQMRGEAVNLSNIERSVSDELKKAGQIIDDQTERLRKRGFFDNAGKMARTIADFIGNILQLIAKAILRILSVALIILGGFLLWLLIGIGMAGSFELNGTSFRAVDLLQNLFDSPWIYYPAISGLLLCCLFPLLFGTAVLIRRLFKLPRINPLFGRLTLGLSLLGLLLFVISLVSAAQEFRVNGSTEEVVMLEYDHKQHIEVIAARDPEGKPVEMDMTVNGEEIDGWIIGAESHYIRRVVFDVASTRSDAPFVQIEKRSKGRSERNAQLNALEAEYAVYETDSLLELPLYYALHKDRLFRFQGVKATIYLPVGYSIRFGNEFETPLSLVETEDDLLQNTWKMTEEGLQCLDCTEQSSEDAHRTSI